MLWRLRFRRVFGGKGASTTAYLASERWMIFGVRPRHPSWIISTQRRCILKTMLSTLFCSTSSINLKPARRRGVVDQRSTNFAFHTTELSVTSCSRKTTLPSDIKPTRSPDEISAFLETYRQIEDRHKHQQL